MGAPILVRQQVVMGIVEAAYGADPGVDPALNAILCSEVTRRPQGDVRERNWVRNVFSGLPHEIGTRFVDLSLQAEIKGGGAPAGTVPEIGPLLRACRLEETVVPATSVSYTPRSDPQNFDSCTLYVHKGNTTDGKYYRVLGCRGNVSFDWEASGFGVANFELRGLYGGEVDIALPAAPVYDSLMPPQLMDASALTLGLYTPKLHRLSFNYNNQIINRLDPVETHGLYQVALAGARTTGSLEVEDELVAVQNFLADWIAYTEKAFQLTYGSAAGNIVTIDAPKVQYISVEHGDRDGIETRILNVAMNGNAGDDEFAITFT